MNKIVSKVLTYLPQKYSKSVSSMLAPKYKVGQRVKFLGLIVDTPKVFNKKTGAFENCAVFYINTDKHGCFYMMKNNPEMIDKLSESFDFFIHSEKMEPAKDGFSIFLPQVLRDALPDGVKSKKVIEDNIISEIMYTTLEDKDFLWRIHNKGYREVNPKESVVFIQNFILHQKEYLRGAYHVAGALFRGLMNNKDENIFVRAGAFGEPKRSPINFYFRHGLAPVNQTRRTLKENAHNPQYGAFMYVPKYSPLYKIVEQSPFCPKKIDKIKPNWFYRKKTI